MSRLQTDGEWGGVVASSRDITDQTVAELDRSTDDATIVRAILEMAQALRFTTVAEGVETAEQAQFLAELGEPHLRGRRRRPARGPSTR